jgi:hypothetical protein
MQRSQPWQEDEEEKEPMEEEEKEKYYKKKALASVVLLHLPRHLTRVFKLRNFSPLRYRNTHSQFHSLNSFVWIRHSAMFSCAGRDRSRRCVGVTQPNEWDVADIRHLFSAKLGQSSLTFESLAITLRTTRFNIQKFYMVLTCGLCVLYGSQNTQRLLSYTALGDWFCITELESVYWAVRTDSLYRVIKKSLCTWWLQYKCTLNILNSFNHLPW